MKLRDRELLASYMKRKDFSQARLARYAGCSRQFIWQLVHGELNSCGGDIGRLIEEALDLLPGTLFVPMELNATGQTVQRDTTRSPSGRAA